jgi:prepilin peptidase CpaA
MATSVLWLGWPATVPFLVVTALCGGALAVSLLALRSVWLRAVVGHGPNWLTRLATPDQAVPYGVAIGLGMLVSYPNSGLFQALVG